MTVARALDLFDELVESDAAARAARLADVARDDASLAQAVARMLAADDRESGLLDRAYDPPPATTETENAPDRSGHRVGGYRLVARVGRGGMGEVYRAERDGGGFAQTVAIKLLRRGLDSDDIVRRFVQERRILARLEHPGIARLIDGGMSDDGLPWIAMEFVDGEPIVAWAQAHALDLPARLALLVAVADALDYAHRRLIVHRDLKPSNVLVGADGAPRLLDFGIAKLLDQPDGETLTSTGMRLLSPAYAAPEQITGEPVGVATDVYALGLLLYELLTGDLPSNRRRATLATLARDLAREPEKPSDVQRRRTGADTTRVVPRALEGDLDTIVMKALAVEPDRRYASAAALADDVRRHLDGRPIAARPDTLSYRVGKFVKRHRGGVAVGVAAALAIVVALVVALWQGAVARREAARAERESIAAQAAAARTTRVKGFMMETFVHADPRRSKSGAPTTIDAAFDDALARIDGLSNEPTLQVDLLDDFGEIRANQGRFDDARALFERALALAEKTHGPNHPAVAESLGNLASLSLITGDALAAEPFVTRALAILDVPDAADPLVLVNPLGALAGVRKAQGRIEEALQLTERSVGLQRRYGRAGDETLAAALHNYASVLGSVGRHDEALAPAREAIALLESLHGRDSVALDPVLQILAYSLYRLGRVDESLALHERRLANGRKAYAGPNGWTVNVLTDVGWLRFEAGQVAEGVAMLDEAIAMSAKLDLRERLLPALRYRAMIHRQLGERAEAMAVFDRAVQLCGGEGKSLYCALVRANRANLLGNGGDPAVALREATAAMAELATVAGPDSSEYGQGVEAYASALAANGRHDEAIAEQQRAVDIYIAIFGEAHEETVRVRDNLDKLRRQRPG